MHNAVSMVTVTETQGQVDSITCLLIALLFPPDLLSSLQIIPSVLGRDDYEIHCRCQASEYLNCPCCSPRTVIFILAVGYGLYVSMGYFETF